MPGTATNNGGADLLVGPNLVVSEHRDAGETAGKNVASLVLAEIWAARQRRPTFVVVSRCAQ